MHVRELLIDTSSHVSPTQAIERLSDQDATRRLDRAPHSIAELVAHMVFWQEWFRRRCDGVSDPVAQTAALGWPDVPANSWTGLQSRFIDGLAALAEMADLTDLAQKVVPAIEVPMFADITKRDAMVHVAVHNGHHLGQIITLRQMMGLWPPPSGGLTW